MTGSDLIQLLGSLGGAGVVAAVVNAVINRRKMGADVTKVIQEAAGTAVERVEKDNARLRLENERVWTKLREVEQENATLVDAMRDQLAYTRRQTEEIRRLGGDVGDPPELPAALLG